MTREELLDEVLKCNYRNIFLELATSVGKTKIAIEKVKQYNPESILILVPRLVLIDNWKEELRKWDAEYLIPRITFSTYISFPKNAGNYDVLIADECHRLTESGLQALQACNFLYTIFLSATLPRVLKKRIKPIIKYPTYDIKVSIEDAIDNEILPEPKIILHSLRLSDFSDITEYNTYRKGKKVTLSLLPIEYYREITKDIEETRCRYESTGMPQIKFKYLNLCNTRLKWLSRLKNSVVQNYRRKYQKKRTLTFCCDTKQADLVCKADITSKSKKASLYLSDFNDGKINHISAVNMLNEGISLKDCQVGIFLYIASSEIIQVQTKGRILRHKNPELVYLYFEDTREEEILRKAKILK